MPHTQQRLKSISIDGLRRIKKLSMSFEGKNITGVFGPNGSGKTTLLYALLCIYKAQQSIQYNFGDFFKKCKAGEYDNTEIKASVYYRDGKEEINTDVTYKKSPNSDRWTPKTAKRPKRDVYYFGINTCVPIIEEEIRITERYTYKDEFAVSDSVKNTASNILGVRYIKISHKKREKKEHYYATVADGSEYYSVSMGAGEQRILRILEFIEKIPAYSLVIIDEIDLTLHTAALNRLIDYLLIWSEDKKCQIIFTSHREELIKRKDINIRHIFQTGTATLCLNETTPTCIDSLTGGTSRPLEIYVEDDLAETIVAKCTCELGIRKRVEIKRFGSCTNAFVLSSALHMMGNNTSSFLFVLDGDLYKTKEERLEQIKKHYTGNEQGKKEAQEDVLNSIVSLNLPNDTSPEQYINNIISKTTGSGDQEIAKAASEIINPKDSHDYLDKIIETIGEDRQIGLYRIIEEFAKHTEWEDYTKQVRDWLNAKKSEFGL